MLKIGLATRFNWTPEQKWLVKTPGIVFGLAMAVRAFTKEGEGRAHQPTSVLPI